MASWYAMQGKKYKFIKKKEKDQKDVKVGSIKNMNTSPSGKSLK
jgi:hypothetical protein